MISAPRADRHFCGVYAVRDISEPRRPWVKEREVGLFLLVLYAGIGLAICFTAHVVSFFAVWPGEERLLNALSLAIFPLWGFTILVMARLARGIVLRPSLRLRDHPLNLLLANCPTWLRWIAFCSIPYSILVGFIMSFATGGKSGAMAWTLSNRADWPAFSAGMLVFYSMALAASTTAYRSGNANLQRGCVNNHIVASSDRFCPECGARIDG